MAIEYWLVRGQKTDLTGGAMKLKSGEALNYSGLSAYFSGGLSPDSDFAGQTKADAHHLSDEYALALGMMTEATGLLIKAGTDMARPIVVDPVYTYKEANTPAVKVCVGADSLVGRRGILVKVVEAGTIYLGKSDVTDTGATKGFPLSNTDPARFIAASDAVDYYMFAATAIDVYIEEIPGV